MSSTSSSDCDNCDYCQCGYSLDSNCNNYCSYDPYGGPVRSSRHVPFYATMGHPLIYYAEVKRPLNRRQRSDHPRKENKNCFVKAFQWYTQERVPAHKNDISGCPDRCGFANWLDTKYIEYLRDSRVEQNVYQLTAQPTTTIEPCETCPSYEPCSTKRFARMKSPWRKRRRTGKDSGDVPEKCTNQSCEFIMQPKDLTRAASDCCYPTPTSGCNKSNATVVSSNAPGGRGTGKSYSMTSVCRERSNQNPIDIIPCTVQEGSKTKQPPKKGATCYECREQIQQVPSKSRKTDVSCQCPEEKVVPVNAETQYEYPSNTEFIAQCKCFVEGYMPVPVQIRSRKLSVCETKPSVAPPTQNYAVKKRVKQSNVTCQCPEESIVTVDTPSQYQTDLGTCECMCRNVVSCPQDRDVKETQQVFGPKTIRRQSYTTMTVNEVDTCECIAKDVTTVTKYTRSLTLFANDGVQTSDHSICFERDGMSPYPLFMKIVCADRLNNVCF